MKNLTSSLFLFLWHSSAWAQGLVVNPPLLRAGDYATFQLFKPLPGNPMIEWFFPQVEFVYESFKYQVTYSNRPSILVVPKGIQALVVRWRVLPNTQWFEQNVLVTQDSTVQEPWPLWCARPGIGLGYGLNTHVARIEQDYETEGGDFQKATGLLTHGHLEIGWDEDFLPSENPVLTKLESRWGKLQQYIDRNHLLSKVNHLYWENPDAFLPPFIVDLLRSTFGVKEGSDIPKSIYDNNPTLTVHRNHKETYKREVQRWLRRILRLTSNTTAFFSIYNEAPVTHCGRMLFGSYGRFLKEVVLPIILQEAPHIITYHNMFSVEDFVQPVRFGSTTLPPRNMGGELMQLYQEYLNEIEIDPSLVQQIGIQAHFDAGLFDVTRIKQSFNQLASYHKPLLVTEFDQYNMTKCHFGLNSAADACDDDLTTHYQTPEQESVQMDNYYKFITEFLPDPRVQGITMFWLWDPGWRPGVGIFRSRDRKYGLKQGGVRILDFLKKYHSTRDPRCSGTPGNGFFAAQGPLTGRTAFDPQNPQAVQLYTQRDSVTYAFHSLYDTDYGLQLTAKHDRPGPVKYLVDVKIGNEPWKPLGEMDFKRNDDSFSSQTLLAIRLRKGAYLFRIKIGQDTYSCVEHHESCDLNGAIRSVRLQTNMTLDTFGNVVPNIYYEPVRVRSPSLTFFIDGRRYRGIRPYNPSSIRPR